MTEVMAFMNVVQALEQFDNIDYIGAYGDSDCSGCDDWIQIIFVYW